MLILTRRVGETIRIDGNIEVTVLSIEEQQVRLGVKAPLSIDIHRQELYQRIHGLRRQRQLLAERKPARADSVFIRNQLALQATINHSSNDHPE